MPSPVHKAVCLCGMVYVRVCVASKNDRRAGSAERPAFLLGAADAGASPFDYVGLIHPCANTRQRSLTLPTAHDAPMLNVLLSCREGERVPRPAAPGHCARLSRRFC